MGFWTKAIVIAAGVFAVGSALVIHDAKAIDIKLVSEKEAASGHLIVDVNAERTNIYNRPWDGIGHVGGLVGPLLPGVAVESPPDMVLCLVKASETLCYANGKRSNPTSFCYDSFHCRWQVDTKRDAAFALVVFDLDIAAGKSISDLVDILVISRKGTYERALETRIRQLVEEVAPTAVNAPALIELPVRFNWRPGEAKRRAGQLVQAPDNYCKSGCPLEQSSITLDWF